MEKTTSVPYSDFKAICHRLREAKSRLLACSFCGRSKADGATLAAGRDVYICSECVEACAEILEISEKDVRTN